MAGSLTQPRIRDVALRLRAYEAADDSPKRPLPQGVQPGSTKIALVFEFLHVDGTMQFRIDDGSLAGSHAPHVPHVHLETYAAGANKPTVNNHIPFTEE